MVYGAWVWWAGRVGVFGIRGLEAFTVLLKRICELCASSARADSMNESPRRGTGCHPPRRIFLLAGSAGTSREENSSSSTSTLVTSEGSMACSRARILRTKCQKQAANAHAQSGHQIRDSSIFRLLKSKIHA